MDKNTIVGYSGHAYVVLDACKKAGININYYCEIEETTHNPYGIKYLGNESLENFNWNELDGFVLGIGDNKIRMKAAGLIAENNKKLITIFHPSAVINDFAKIGVGAFVSSNVVINPLVTVEDFSIINTGTIVEHECIIKKGAHIAPGAVLAGNVWVGELSFIGANSFVKQGIKIGNNVIIGAGSVVLQDVPDNEVWAGNPAKRIK